MFTFPALVLMSLTIGQPPGGLDIGKEDPPIPLPAYSARLPWIVRVVTSLVGRILCEFIHRGMTDDQVQRILGRPRGWFSGGAGGFCHHYPLLNLSVCYHTSFHRGAPFTLIDFGWLGIPRH